MTTLRYQLCVIGGSGEAGADALAHQGLQDEPNDLGQQGWELTAVTATRVTLKSLSSNSRRMRRRPNLVVRTKRQSK
jgi:hypothetical protein